MAFLKAFNPHELSAGTVRGVVTGREDPLGRIVSIVRANLDAPTPQHVIVSAPRGYGKSFFLRYVEVELDQLARAEGLPVAMALLPEELPHVKEPETLLAEIRRTFLGLPADTIGVSWVEDDGQSWDHEVAWLDAAIAERFGGKPGLLVAAVENFDLLLKKAFAKPVQAARLREWLTRRGNRLMLIAASARGAFDRDYDRPLFKAFEEMSFEPWTIDQSLAFFRSQRAAAGKAPLTETQAARAKAVATFIGGTPRLATLIGEALLEDDPLGAADLLEKLVDELTPYYKERIEVLPSRSQALLDALLRGGENCSATELARRVGAPSQPAIAAALDELKKDLLVTGAKAPDSAEVLLRVTDRVFAHYYRKRILSHGLETCPLEALVDLLAVIYSPEEKKREAAKLAARGLAREAQVFERLWAADQSRVERRARDETTIDKADEFAELITAFRSAADAARYSEGLAILDQALALATATPDTAKQARALQRRAWTLGELGRHDEALATAREAAVKAESAGDIREQAAALRHAAWNLGQLGRHDEALTAAREAVVKAESAGDNREQAETLRHAAWNLGRLGRHDEAIATARQAAAKADSAGDIGEQARALRFAAWSLEGLGRHDEALATAREAAAKAESAGDSREQAGALLEAAWNLMQLGRRDEAIAIAREAAALAEKVSDRELSLAVARTLLQMRPGDADIDLAYRSYEYVIEGGDADDPGLYFDDIADVATRTSSWPRLIAMLASRPVVAETINQSSVFIGHSGGVVARALLNGEREDALTMARHVVSALAQAIEAASDPRPAGLWSAILAASAEAITTAVAEAAFLSEIADILAAHASVPVRATSLLAAAAAYHAGGRDSAALARLDPDLATTLMVVFPPDSAKQSEPRRRKPRAKRPSRR
ncbi:MULTISPECIES: tetratricopeptide repeat protein [Rhodopseudomonas]|uniref:Uncharacterized protein n=1 Tax=Rhodopseudomonas palustris TaxID=1076 RepID=A0A0D7EIE5_RHOPL|nr:MULTISPECIES: tetratricopeptide repeat protein [Rhodopseudomonas]KIZ40280.1 hypothetical protein OO17_18025 [Rhodopseudomonas palustris]MDF3809763.1 tetratricopeptide repeat protein [Rhodopseudomonas sp. BAL398]WOK16750.1 tetratricopeptide repeat protein [Rhodopseudomonas sp. BAL398]